MVCHCDICIAAASLWGQKSAFFRRPTQKWRGPAHFTRNCGLGGYVLWVVAAWVPSAKKIPQKMPKWPVLAQNRSNASTGDRLEAGNGILAP